MNDVSDIFLLETIKSLKGLKSTAEKAMAQISQDEMHFSSDPESNSVAVIDRLLHRTLHHHGRCQMNESTTTGIAVK